MAGSVILYNQDKRQVFVGSLYHSIACKNAGICYCTEHTVPSQAMPIRVEASFRIPPRSFSDPLPAEVLDIPQVKTAMQGDRPWLVQRGRPADIVKLPSD